jgi:hypothetical protein
MSKYTDKEFRALPGYAVAMARYAGREFIRARAPHPTNLTGVCTRRKPDRQRNPQSSAAVLGASSLDT